MSKLHRYALFALTYFVQGSIQGYFTAFNVIYLRSCGITDNAKIGLMAGLAMIPFVIKIFFGMLSDKHNLLKMGHRKPYIILGLIIQALSLLLISFINPGVSFTAYAVVAFILMCGMALYDTTTDGFALDTTSKDEQGVVQGLMVGGRALGVVVLAPVIGFLANRFSWQFVFIFMGVVTVMPVLLALGMKEKAREAVGSFEWKAFKAFSAKPVLWLGILGALYSFVIYGAQEFVNPFFLERFELSTQQAGLFTMVWGIGVVFGGLTGGKLVDWIGQRKAVFYAVAAAFASLLLLIVVQTPLMAYILIFVFGLAFGYYETVYFALSMAKSDPRIAASMYAILMAVANLGTGLGLFITGVFVENFNYAWSFVLLALINLLAIPMLPLIFGKAQKTQKQPTES